MDSEGQNPASVLASIHIKKNKLHEELSAIEKQVYELETSYLQDSSHVGNVLKGYEGYLSSSKTTTNVRRSRKFQTEDRLFSLSSVTSPAAEEVRNGQDEGGRTSEFGSGRSKGGGMYGADRDNLRRKTKERKADWKRCKKRKNLW